MWVYIGSIKTFATTPFVMLKSVVDSFFGTAGIYPKRAVILGISNHWFDNMSDLIFQFDVTTTLQNCLKLPNRRRMLYELQLARVLLYFESDMMGKRRTSFRR